MELESGLFLDFVDEREAFLYITDITKIQNLGMKRAKQMKQERKIYSITSSEFVCVREVHTESIN